MKVLILGLVLFFATHSIRIVADAWRTRQIERFGANAWKGVYSIVSLVGLGLIIWGYALARHEPSVVWQPPPWTRHAAALLTLPAFVLLAAAYVPGNAIKAAVGHPMVLGVKTWALAHLLANGNVADVVLFGAFLVWAVFSYRTARMRDSDSARRRDSDSARKRDSNSAGASDTLPRVMPGRAAIAGVAGVVAWALFAFWLHRALIGVAPFR